MKAHARVAVSASSDGTTRYDELRSDAPILLRPVNEALYIVGGAASPLGGDDLRLEIELQSGVSLVVRSTAASLARRGIHELSSMMSISAHLAEKASLWWLVEPAVACFGCDHYVDVTVDMAENSNLYWRDELVLGRQGEESGKWSSRLSADIAGQPLVRSEFSTRWPGWNGPAVAGSNEVIGSILIAGECIAGECIAGAGIAGAGIAGAGIAGAGIAGADTFCCQNTVSLDDYTVSSGGHTREVHSKRPEEVESVGRGTCMPLNGPGVMVSAVARDLVTLRQVAGALLQHHYIT